MTSQVNGLSQKGVGYFNDVSLMILEIHGMLDDKTFEHKTGITQFKKSYTGHFIKYKIWCLDEEDNNLWKCVASGYVRNIKHLRQLRRINKLEQAIFA